jgi:hypothetical protein
MTFRFLILLNNDLLVTVTDSHFVRYGVEKTVGQIKIRIT